MAHQMEPMDIDNIVSDFDDKENAINHSNVLPRTPCTEKGYEELDVSELNMKLRYSITPASSPMSKSFTANCLDNKNHDSIHDISMNDSLTRSLNSTITRNDNVNKSIKSLPLQVLPSDQFVDGNRNASVLRALDSTLKDENNVIVTITEPNDDENLSLPSSSSSIAHTPEATTPTKELPRNDDGSPILRGLKSVFNIFRSSQSPIPPTEDENKTNKDSPLNNIQSKYGEANETEPPKMLASTPVSAHRNKEANSKRSSPQKESIVFNDDLEKELQWNDDSAIIFKHEKIPIHRLIFSHTKSLVELTLMKNANPPDKSEDVYDVPEKLQTSVEYMDISYNDLVVKDKTLTDLKLKNDVNKSVTDIVESDSEFLDCESNATKHESQLLEFTDVDIDVNKSVNNMLQLNNDNSYNNCTSNAPVLNSTKESLDTTMAAQSGDISMEPDSFKKEELKLEKTALLNKTLHCNQGFNEADKVHIENIQEGQTILEPQIIEQQISSQQMACQVFEKSETNVKITKNNSNTSNSFKKEGLNLENTMTLNKTLDSNQGLNEVDKDHIETIQEGQFILEPQIIEQKIFQQSACQVFEKSETNVIITENISNICNLSESKSSNSLFENDSVETKCNAETKCLKDITASHILCNDKIVTINPGHENISFNESYKTQDIGYNVTHHDFAKTVSPAFDIPLPDNDEIDEQAAEVNDKLNLKLDINNSETNQDTSEQFLTDTICLPIQTEAINTSGAYCEIQINQSTEATKISDDIKINKNILVSSDCNIAEHSSENLDLQEQTLDVQNTELDSIKNEFQEKSDTECKDLSYSVSEEGTSRKIKDIHDRYISDGNNTEKNKNTNEQIPSSTICVPIETKIINTHGDEIHANEPTNICDNFKINKNILISSDCNLTEHSLDNVAKELDMIEKSLSVDDIKNEFHDNLSIEHKDLSYSVSDGDNFSKVEDTEGKFMLNKNNSETHKHANESEQHLSNTKCVPIQNETTNTPNSYYEMHVNDPTEVINMCDDKIKENILVSTDCSLAEHSSEKVVKVLDVVEQTLDVKNTKLEDIKNEFQINFNMEDKDLSYSRFEKDNSSKVEDIECRESNENIIQSITSSNPIDVETEDSPETQVSEHINEISASFNSNINVSINTIELSKTTNKIQTELIPLLPVDNTVNTAQTSVKDESLNKSSNEQDVIKNVDEEIVVSENTSPYVSLTGEIEKSESLNKDETTSINNTNEHRISPPRSPAIVSKGYNFNFDEIDDPFATKTKIRSSPPPGADNETFEVVERKIENTIPKKEINKNRRKSQPDRKRPNINKKNFNKTFNGTLLGTTPNKSQKSMVTNEKLEHLEITNDAVVFDSIDTKQAINEVLDTFSQCKNHKEQNVTPVEELQVDTKSDCNAPIITQPDENKIDVEPNNHFTNEPLDNEMENVNKTSSESFHTTEIKNMSSSEHSIPSPTGTVNDTVISKNVFNLPEIDDMNFNPFFTKTKIRLSPVPNVELEDPFATKNNIKLSPNSSFTVEKDDCNITNVNMTETALNINNTTSSSKNTDDIDNTVREVHTEDEDTVEGPFLDNEEFSSLDKITDFKNNKDNLMQFSNLPAQGSGDNLETGEIFIDAEAYEFLLNQNINSEVTDSGKESLFLKFDPLFAKRASSDGVLAALSQIHKKKSSTPKKVTKTPQTILKSNSPVPGPSDFSRMHGGDINSTMDMSYEELNVTVAKPMMVVNPAVNPVVLPRNKSLTPTRSNRRSFTFTSPAMAAIDRLLSLSGNTSLLGDDSTSLHLNREQHEAELALTQLRELLSEKEINVHHLKSENKELKDRLLSMEAQLIALETESHERLKKVNELNEALTEKTKRNRSMAIVVEEYERTIASLINETEQDRKRHAEERSNLIKERDEQAAHLANLEVSFGDLHSKYEKSKQVILSFKAHEDAYKKSIKDFEENLKKMQSNYELLKQHATSKLNHANQELEKINRAHEAEMLKLNAMIKRKDLHITSLEETLAQKTKANEELTAICDELINKVG